MTITGHQFDVQMITPDGIPGAAPLTVTQQVTAAYFKTEGSFTYFKTEGHDTVFAVNNDYLVSVERLAEPSGTEMMNALAEKLVRAGNTGELEKVRTCLKAAVERPA